MYKEIDLGKIYLQVDFPSSRVALKKGLPDWAYEFPCQRGPDTQICWTGLPDRTESGLIILNILPLNRKKYEKKTVFFFYFEKSSPGRKKSGFRTLRILKICRTSGPDVMSG